MKEKLDFKTDIQVRASTIIRGVDPITGLEMRRRFKGLQSDLHSKEHIITYEEWLIAKDGKIYENFYQIKQYRVIDITTPPEYLAYTQWFDQLSPVLLPAINNTLLAMPLDAKQWYIVTK